MLEEVVAQVGQDQFVHGVDLLRQGNAEEALTSLQTVLQHSAHDPALLTNLGIAAARLEKWGLSLSYLREAQELGSSYPQTATALNYVTSQMKIREIPHQVEFWEVFRSNVLQGISLYTLMFIGAFVILLTGLLVLRFINDRKSALASEEALPNVRFIHILAGVLFCAWLGLTLAKVVDQTHVRAIVTNDVVSVKSAANPEAPTLFELYAGLEVIVQRESGDWAQIRYPGGPAGWIKKQDFRVFSPGLYR